MSDSKSAIERSLPIVIGIGLCVLVLMSLIPIWGEELYLGWIKFLRRVLPEVQVRWDGIAVFVVGLAIAWGTFHYLMRWWIAERERLLRKDHKSETQGDEAIEFRWRLRSSLASVVMILLVFVVGISMAGVVHQSVWLINSPHSLTVGKVQSEDDAKMSIYDPELTPVGKSWLTSVLIFLPYMLDGELKEGPFNNAANAAHFKTIVPQAVCPSQGVPIFSQDGFGLTHVEANPSALGGKLAGKNGSSIMLGEVNAAFTPWGTPDSVRDPALGIRSDWRGTSKGKVGLGSSHPTGVNIALVDGSTKFLNENVDPQVLKQLSNAKRLAE